MDANRNNGKQAWATRLSTETRKDFEGKLTAEKIDQVSKDQAFVVQNDAQLGGTIYVRTEPSDGFYQLSRTSSDFVYYGASAVSHEQVHLRGGGEFAAYLRQDAVFHGFKNYIQSPSVYGGLDETIHEGIKKYQPNP